MQRIATSLGHIAVDVIGSGPHAVLWHSAFVDRRSWQRVIPALSEVRTLVVVDGPGFGDSDPLTRPHTLRDEARATIELLDSLEIESVDWVGNAWGGHTGIVLGAMRPDRVRSLISIGAPVHALGAKGGAERMLLVSFRPVLRVIGYAGPLGVLMASFLLNPRTMREDRDAVRIVVSGMRRPGRASFDRFLASSVLGRKDVTAEALSLPMPVLFVAGDDRGEWTPSESKAVTDRMTSARTVTLHGSRGIAALEHPGEVVRIIREFWATV